MLAERSMSAQRGLDIRLLRIHPLLIWLCGLSWVLLSLNSTADDARAEWTASTEAKSLYTTDAFQFSNARQLRLSDDPTQPAGVNIGKSEDLIFQPALELVRSSSSFLGPNEVALKAEGSIYTNNPIFNHGDYRVQFKQSLTPQMSLLVRYRYQPNLFLGPNFEHRTGESLIAQERVTSHHWRAELERHITKDITLTAIGRYGLRFYNEAFAERDTRFWTSGPKITYRVLSDLTVRLGYLYERGLADGMGNTQFNDDVSYRLHFVSFETEIGLNPLFSLTLMYHYVRKNFTSDLTGDTHVGRQDETHQGIAELLYHLTEAAGLTVGFQHTQRTSTNALREFNDSIVSVGGQYRF